MSVLLDQVSQNPMNTRHFSHPLLEEGVRAVRYPTLRIGARTVLSLHRSGVIRWRDSDLVRGTWGFGVRGYWASILMREARP